MIRALAGVVLAAVVISLTPGATAQESPEALWPTGFSPGLSASDCGSYRLDDEGFCHADDRRNGLEVGMKFQTAREVQVTGLRIYRVEPNSVRGSLWSGDATLLARGTFADKDNHGWQDMSFAAPVTIRPGETYVASYFTPGTKYAFAYGYFDSGRTVGPITAPRSTQGSPNGVHCYDDAGCGSFPVRGFKSSSYWVTPLWRELGSTPPGEDDGGGGGGGDDGGGGDEGGTSDTTAPRVTNFVRAGSTVTVRFSEPVRRTSLTRRSVRLMSSTGARIRTDLRPTDRRVVIDPRPKLRPGKYRVVITRAVRDRAGNRLARQQRYSFRVR